MHKNEAVMDSFVPPANNIAVKGNTSPSAYFILTVTTKIRMIVQGTSYIQNLNSVPYLEEEEEEECK